MILLVVGLFHTNLKSLYEPLIYNVLGTQGGGGCRGDLRPQALFRAVGGGFAHDVCRGVTLWFLCLTGGS